MSKNILIAGLVLTLVASTVGGVFTAENASAESYYPYGLQCSPTYQYADSGQYVTFNATYGGWYTNDLTQRILTWSAPGGDPSYGTGYLTSFTTRFSTQGYSEVRLVTVSDGIASATCTVYVNSYYPYPTWTPTPTVTPTAQVYLSPTNSSADSGESVAFTAWGGNGTYSWDAPNGSPSTGWGASYSTRFYNYTTGTNYYEVVVYSGSASARAWVGVRPYGNATPTPWPGDLDCSPSFTTTDSGDRVRFTATGGNGHSYSWSAPEGNPSSGTGSSFSTRFTNESGSTRDYWVTVTSDAPYHWQTDSCQVRVYSDYTTPTPTPYGTFGFEHSVRNLTRGGEGAFVNASNGDRLQFTARITAGNRTAEDIHIRDWLPQYLSYVYGSTTVDGEAYQDGIATGAPDNSLALYDLKKNRTYTIRFEATVNGAPSGTLINSINAHVRGATDQNRTSTIYVSGGSYVTPTPTYTPTASPVPGTLTLGLTGRNITRGQTGEYRSVSARGGDTIGFVLRVRAPSTGSLTNTVVTDYLPSGLTFNSTTTTRDGIAEADGITSGGLTLGTLWPGQEVVIRFSARVNPDAVPSLGTVTITDSAQVRADGWSTTGATMRITLGTDESLALVSAIKTGPNDALWLALLIALMVTGLYAGYTRTDVFGRRMTKAEITALVRRGTLNFSR